MRLRSFWTLGPFVLFVVSLAATPAAAQQRPLVTEDPETVGAGNVLFDGGFDYGWDVFYPLSGLKGNLLRAPLLGASFGISSIADLRLAGGLYNRLSITHRLDAPFASETTFTGDTTHDVEDMVLSTKVRVLSETANRPAVGLRFATRLPNSKHHSGLGLDSFDFHVQGLVGKTVQSIRVVGNVGLGILAAPAQPQVQNDVLDYGLSVARAVRENVEVVGEINGRISTRSNEPPIGTESRGAVRLGGRLTRGTVRLDSGIILGLTSQDPGFGFTVGATWVFKGFTVP